LKQSMPRRAVSTVLSYLLSLVLILCAGLLILNGTLLSPEYHVRTVDRSGFVPTALSEIQEIYVSCGLASGLPEEVMRAAVTAEEVDAAAKNAIRAAFGTEQPYNPEAYAEDLYQRLYAYAKDAGGTEDEVRELSELCLSAFSTRTGLDVYSYIGQTEEQLRRYMDIAVTALGIVSLFFIVCLIVLNRRGAQLGRYGVYVFGTCTLVFAIIPGAAHFSGGLGRINISPESYKLLFTSVASGFFGGFLWVLLPAAV